MQRKTKQQGFTLIELIVVIVILGILSAIALPRFVDLQVQARQAKLNAAVGAVKSGMALFHAQCLVGLSALPVVPCPLTGAAFTLNMEGTAVGGINQYPAATLAGIASAAGISAAAAAGPGIDYVLTGAAPTVTISVSTPTAGTCQFTYTAATAAAGVLTAAPVVTLVAAGSTCT